MDIEPLFVLPPFFFFFFRPPKYPNVKRAALGLGRAVWLGRGLGCNGVAAELKETPGLDRKCARKGWLTQARLANRGKHRLTGIVRTRLFSNTRTARTRIRTLLNLIVAREGRKEKYGDRLRFVYPSPPPSYYLSYLRSNRHRRSFFLSPLPPPPV